MNEEFYIQKLRELTKKLVKSDIEKVDIKKLDEIGKTFIQKINETQLRNE